MNSKSPQLHRAIEGITAFDRLEADKAKYVKTPQVREQRQNPAINATLSPTLLRRSIQSNHNHKQETKHTGSCSLSPVIQPRTLQRHVEQRTEESCITSSTITMSGTPLLHRKTLNLKTEHATSTTIPSDMPKSPFLYASEPRSEKTFNFNCPDYTAQKNCEPKKDNNGVPSPRSPKTQPFSMRRFSGKRQHRPDSLIIYRQRRDIVQNEKENNESSGGLVNRLLQSTPLLKRRIPFAQGSSQPCSQERPNSPRAQKKTNDTLMCPVPNFSSSREAISTEQSSFPTSDVQHFFESCGLEGSLLDLLDNVYQLGEDTTIGSLESVDRVSGRSVVLHEEVKEERTPVSVIERNARVIKWIYSCHNAKAINIHRENNKSRESTV
ncbi:glycine/arginine rich protein 1 isoform X1 [Xenopus laevis]|uniref:Glycine/arginine rich protein 1 isoform X1 n=2 Tax=Xenopus laevis TaxID=8355 RepID=A0A1L8H7A8_XENLA|nr:glycine/arginine rich protein 1 isoform X1 [Xenopus laevis]OCT91987.1 hypothetical protein XELAEV_18015044mg [Xenopus laevis]